jgi:hypothetical protein
MCRYPAETQAEAGLTQASILRTAWFLRIGATGVPGQWPNDGITEHLNFKIVVCLNFRISESLTPDAKRRRAQPVCAACNTRRAALPVCRRTPLRSRNRPAGKGCRRPHTGFAFAIFMFCW